MRKWRDSQRSRSVETALPITAEDVYLAAIEQMHEFCESHELQFKSSMVQALEQWMARRRGEATAGTPLSVPIIAAARTNRRAEKDAA